MLKDKWKNKIVRKNKDCQHNELQHLEKETASNGKQEIDAQERKEKKKNNGNKKKAISKIYYA